MVFGPSTSRTPPDPWEFERTAALAGGIPAPYFAFMKTYHWLMVLGVMGCVACGNPGTAQPPATNTNSGTREAAVTDAANTNCDTYSRCDQIGPDKAYASQDDCVSQRSNFWNDHWSASDCDGKINPDKVQTCLDALQTIACNSLIDELKVINTQCAVADVCGGNQ